MTTISLAYNDGYKDCYDNKDNRRYYSGNELAAYENGWLDAFSELVNLEPKNSFYIDDRLY